MSNKPLKLLTKGRPLTPPVVKEPSRAGPVKHPKRRQSLRNVAVKVGLAIGLFALCAVYAAELNHPATTVLAQKRELPVYCVDREDKVLAISFDASWGADKTIAILDTLDRYGVKTTFFLVGGWVDKYPEMVKAIAARGHEIGNHSDSHPQMSKLSEKKIQDELRLMSDKVEKLIGVRPTLFRPPYGDYNDRVIQVARQEGYEAVQWSIDSLDWKDRGTADIIKQCTYRVDKGDIVLFHNDSKDIMNALPTVIQHYQGLGYTIVPVSEILLQGETTIDVQGKQHAVNAAQPKP